MYPYFKDFKIETKLRRINMDEYREKQLARNKGFLITSSHKNIKKAIVSKDSIFSSNFGRSLEDVNKFGNRYKCDCGRTTYRINNGTICPYCGTEVKYVDDDLEYKGFLKLEGDYYTIHPNLFKVVQYYIGTVALDNMIRYDDDKDRDGLSIANNPKRTADEPFYGIGMIEFHDRFDEIMEFYKNKNKKNKTDYYESIMENRDKIFTQTIAVFTTLLRASKNDPNVLKYEASNEKYMIISRLVHAINQNASRSAKSKKPKSQLLYDLQMKIDELYDMIIGILAGKKGKLRGVFGGRYAFTSRDVIVSNASLRVDQIIMPYQAMVELEKQRIINVLEKVHNSPSIANRIYEDALRKKDPEVENIIRQLIRDDPTGYGIPCIVNRNPTIEYGSILQMFVIDICDDYTLQMPLQILPMLNADFDGDVLNVARIICDEFYQEAFKIFNPRNAMYISRNDGFVSTNILPYKDIMINSNTMKDYYSQGYTQLMIEHNNSFIEKYNIPV